MRTSLYWNVATVVLLVIIAVGIFTIPRFNYGALLARQAKVETSQAALVEKVKKVNLLAGDGETDRAALVGTLNSIPDLITVLDDSIGSTTETVARLIARVEALETWVESDRAQGVDDSSVDADAEEESALGPNDLESLFAARYGDAIELPPKLRERAAKVSAREAAEWRAEEFLAFCVDADILEFESLDAIPDDARSGVVAAFSVYRGSVEIVNHQERLYIGSQVANATDRGEYVDVPRRHQGDPERPRVKLDRGVLHVEVHRDEGFEREFRFPLEQHPELTHLETLRENARDHLVRDMEIACRAAADDQRGAVSDGPERR